MRELRFKHKQQATKEQATKELRFEPKKQIDYASVLLKRDVLACQLRKWNKKATRYVLLIDDALASDITTAAQERLLKFRDDFESVADATATYAETPNE